MKELTEKRKGVHTVIVLTALVITFVLGFLLGGRSREVPSSPGHDGHEPVSGSASKTAEVVTWTCSMHPQIRLPTAGQCPICFMDLIPLTQDPSAQGEDLWSLRQITLTDEARRLAEVEVTPVVRRTLSTETRMVGKVAYDETELAYITTWVAGRIDKLYVDYTGSIVSPGQPMASIYSPELLTAQAELIQAAGAFEALQQSGLRRVRDAAEQTERAAREKLRLLGLTNNQIETVVKNGSPSDHITLYASGGGVVIEKDVLEGMYVETGSRIYTIADLSRVWVVLEAYESDLPWVKTEEEVAFQTEAHPGEVFRGRVVYIDPRVDETTRTVEVRLAVPNAHGKLKPGMFVRAVKQTTTTGEPKELVVPASAPLITGKRAIVYVQLPGREGAYEGREIVLGPRAGDVYVVKSGLSESELVVTKGNFRVDSAVQLLAKPSMMNPSTVQAASGHPGQRRDDLSAPGALHEDGVTLPYAFADGLTRLAQAYERVRAAAALNDLTEITTAFEAFGQTLQTIERGSLPSELALLWKETAMVLGNDAFLGSRADTAAEGVRLFATLTKHVQAAKPFSFERFLETIAVSASVPEGFKKSAGKLFSDYLAVQTALASDNYAAAEKAGGRFRNALKRMDTNRLEGRAHTVWMKALRSLQEGIEQIGDAKEIEEFRAGFEQLSTGMIRIVEQLGVQSADPVFELYCPMAFNDRGASWLQTNEDIFNPYFGDRMLKCGEVRRKLQDANPPPSSPSRG